MHAIRKNLEVVFGGAKPSNNVAPPAETVESLQRKQSFDNARKMLEAQMGSNTNPD
jgi:hypothetical protein